QDGDALSASFNGPYGVSVDAGGNVYVADWGNYKIRKISVGGQVSTFAGSGGEGVQDGDAVSASFNRPFGVAVDAGDNVYVSDVYNYKIRKVHAAETFLSGVPAHDDAGSHSIVLEVSDGQVHETQSFTLEVLPPIFNMSEASITGCEGFYKDPGGGEKYDFNLDITQTLYPGEAGKNLQLSFTSFEVDNDLLSVYDGEDINAPLLAVYSGTRLPFKVQASNPSGALTLRFVSNNSSVNPPPIGWEASFSCHFLPPVNFSATLNESTNEALLTWEEGSDRNLTLEWARKADFSDAQQISLQPGTREYTHKNLPMEVALYYRIKTEGSFFSKVETLVIPGPDGLLGGVFVENYTALAVLYQLTAGDSWKNNEGWLEGDVENWYGVEVEGNRVINLNLGSNGLSGSIPVELG
ncbi:CUB domain-containing protein, partial [Xanthovirga aplysinae]|uniref:CUB domain-containing protein n=1 Tax=Xanthovirga aplysinae TaxID=2529853 RepID=UPI0031B5A3E0|nr:hypothetical protein [Xanthovirga aplysinae]